MKVTFPSRPAGKSGLLMAMSPDQLFDALAVRLRSEDVGGLQVAVNFTFTDLGEHWALRLSNRTLHAVPHHDMDAAVTFALTKTQLFQISEGLTTFAACVADGTVQADGDLDAAGAIFDHLDVFMTNFAIVEP